MSKDFYQEKGFTDLKEIARKSSPEINNFKDIKAKLSISNDNKQEKTSYLVNDNFKSSSNIGSNNFKYIRFLIIAGFKLKMSDISVATASMIFHKIFEHLKSTDFDPYLLVTGSIYLACKVEEEETIKLRDIINVCYRDLHPDSEPLEISEKYWSLRNSIVQTELFISRVLSFEFEFEHPHKFLLQYLDSLRHWIPLDIKNPNPLIETSYHMLRDLLHSDIFLRYRPQDIAISIIYLVTVCYGIKIPYNNVAKNDWWKAFDDKSSLKCIYDVIEEILEIYELEDQYKDF